MPVEKPIPVLPFTEEYLENKSNQEVFDNTLEGKVLIIVS